MPIYIIYIPQINSYGDLHEDDLSVSWHSTKAGAEKMLKQQREIILRDNLDVQITGREDEDSATIISEHCYIIESELSD